MRDNDIKYQAYIKILRKELVPAMGCTEPVSLAFAAASARDILETLPDEVIVETSRNIIKNTKSVIVPNTDGMKGIPVAVAAGIVAGNAKLGLEVISQITEKDKRGISAFLASHDIKVLPKESEFALDITITLVTKHNKVSLRICESHTNIVFIEKNGCIIKDEIKAPTIDPHNGHSDYDLLNIKDIINFADIVSIEDIRELIERQIAFNSAIAKDGIANDYGANIGKVLLAEQRDLKTRAKAMTAAASDARMGGCEMPVIIVSGSGNQGITATLPIVEYARELDVSHEKLIRAIVLSDLITLHQKRYIGRLSAYCGVVCAGAASGAGVAYLHGGGYEEIAHTIVNALAITSGILCDGAKPSCAAKIAMAVDAGIMGYHMYRSGQEFYFGDGIVKRNVEETIKGVGIIGSVGMKATDETIIDLMLKDIVN